MLERAEVHDRLLEAFTEVEDICRGYLVDDCQRFEDDLCDAAAVPPGFEQPRWVGKAPSLAES